MCLKSEFYSRILIKQASSEDIEILKEMISILPISGVYENLSPNGQLAYIRHIIKSDLGVIILAIDTSLGKGVGYIIVLRKADNFYFTFAVKHPIYVALLFLKKYLIRIRVKFMNIIYGNNTVQSSFRWSKSNDKNARVIFIGVLPEYRGFGIGQGIYEFLFDTLRKKKVNLLEAHIDEGNEASLKLHMKVGFVIEKLTSGDYKAYKVL